MVVKCAACYQEWPCGCEVSKLPYVHSISDMICLKTIEAGKDLTPENIKAEWDKMYGPRS